VAHRIVRLVCFRSPLAVQARSSARTARCSSREASMSLRVRRCRRPRCRR
jgi:hypothetical protein